MSTLREGDTVDVKRRGTQSSMGSDTSFHVAIPTPVITLPDEAPNSVVVPVTDPTFIQNQISLQRNPSIAKHPISSQLSKKLDSVNDAGLSQSGGLTVLSTDETQHNDRPSSTGITEGVRDCALSKSSSTATNKSGKSIGTLKSIKSAQSVPALGIHPLGTLRLHDANKEAKTQRPDCLLSGDVIVVTGMPSGCFFGYDTVSLSIGKDGHFEGVKDIPSGPHFIYGGSKSEVSTRNGFWIMSESRASEDHGEVFVKHWDNYNETLEDEISEAEIRIQTQSISAIFDKLLPYSTRATMQTSPETAILTAEASRNKNSGIKDPKMWQRLTFAIKGAMLTRISKHDWNKWQVSSTDDCQLAIPDRPRDAKRQTRMHEAEERSERIGSKERVLNFVFPNTTKTYSNEVVGRARTEQAMDTSAHITAVIEDRCTFEDPDEVIGELQYCYITGMCLGNVTCMEQWAHIVKIMFRAFRLAMDMPLFFCKAIEAIHAQLIYDEEGFEGSIFDQDPHLQDDIKHTLTIFKSRLNEQLLSKGASLTDNQNNVGKAFEALESWLWKWGWDLRGNYVRSGKIQLEDGEFVDAEMNAFEDEDERGEYAPMVVQLEDDGREKGLLRW